MGFLGSGYGAHPMMNLVNFGLRICQFLLAIATLGLYAKEMQVEGKESEYGHHSPKTVSTALRPPNDPLAFGLWPALS